MNNGIDNILAVLNPDNTMSINRPLAHAIGMNESIVYAALISKHSYYLATGRLTEDGWFFSTVTDLQESTTFGRKAQTSAVNNLISIGLIECELRGMPARRYFRVCDNAELLMHLISKGLTASKALSENCGKRSKKSEKREQPNSENDDVEKMLKTVEIGFEKKVAETAQHSSSYPRVQTSSSLSDDKSKENKTKEIKADDISNHSIHSDAREKNFSANVEKTETSEGDQSNKINPFCEMLAELGVRSEIIFAYEPKSEKDLADFDDGERDLELCRIPCSFHSNKQVMTEALKYMSGYSYFWETESENSQAKFHSCCVNVLADMLAEDSIRVGGKQVMYYTMLEKVNTLANRNLLSEAFFGFSEEWKKVTAGRQITDRKVFFLVPLEVDRRV